MHNNQRNRNRRHRFLNYGRHSGKSGRRRSIRTTIKNILRLNRGHHPRHSVLRHSTATLQVRQAISCQQKSRLRTIWTNAVAANKERKSNRTRKYGNPIESHPELEVLRGSMTWFSKDKNVSSTEKHVIFYENHYIVFLTTRTCIIIMCSM